MKQFKRIEPTDIILLAYDKLVDMEGSNESTN